MGKALAHFLRKLVHRLLVAAGSIILTLIFFLVLPLMQTITRPPQADMTIRSVDTAKLEAPPPPPEPEQQKEPEPEEQPPQLAEEAPPLDLSQLELALNPGFGDGALVGDFAIKLNTVVAQSSDNVDALFSITDLDQKPRAIFQPSPVMTRELRRKAPGTVYVVFVVDPTGRVESAIAQQSSDPIFEKPALNAIKQWKFEPGKRNGQPVRFRMRVPITFPKG